MSIGLIISNLINEKGVTKKEFAEFLGVARNTLDDYLLEKTYMTSDKIKKISEYFKVPISYLFGENTDNNKINKLEFENKKNPYFFIAIPIDNDDIVNLNIIKEKAINILSINN